MARPLCCCAGERAEEQAPASDCCPTEAASAAPTEEGRPCGEDGSCGNCNTIFMIASAGRVAIEVAPHQGDQLTLLRRPTVIGHILSSDSDRSRHRAWIHFRVAPSPPLLCVFRT